MCPVVVGHIVFFSSPAVVFLGGVLLVLFGLGVPLGGKPPRVACLRYKKRLSMRASAPAFFFRSDTPRGCPKPARGLTPANASLSLDFFRVNLRKGFFSILFHVGFNKQRLYICLVNFPVLGDKR